MKSWRHHIILVVIVDINNFLMFNSFQVISYIPQNAFHQAQTCFYFILKESLPQTHLHIQIVGDSVITITPLNQNASCQSYAVLHSGQLRLLDFNIYPHAFSSVWLLNVREREKICFEKRPLIQYNWLTPSLDRCRETAAMSTC